MVDLRVSFRWDATAAKTDFYKAIERARLHRLLAICTDKAPAFRRIIREINRPSYLRFDSIRQIDRQWCNNRIESDPASMKQLRGYRQSFRSLRPAKATLSGIKTIRSIKKRPHP